MLPDLTNLCQHSDEIKDDRSLEQTDSKRSSKPRGFDKPAKKRDRQAYEGRRDRYPKKKKRAKRIGQYIVETLDSFRALWRHRFDYIYAPHPAPDTKPNWQTETRYPLSDRIMIQGAYLFGVRPGPDTDYALLDIDRGSPYHPQRDPLALARINETLEPLGLVANIVLTSSGSLGLHIYFPCSEALPSWQLGIAITTLLENKGFRVIPGWLEVFPNRKPYAADGSYSLFNAHRLPLQQGSYLLNDDLQPIASSEELFVCQWQQAAARNDISIEVLEQTIRQAKRKAYRMTGKARKFLNDLNAEIELGWTGTGQTNRLLGRIAMRSYIFGHVLGADAPLKGKALAEDIARVARALPGFNDYCGHQEDLDKRAKSYARAIERERGYYPYASGKALKVKTGPTENERRAAEAREHIQQATIALFRQNACPEKATARFKLLCDHNISGSTLYKNKDLWHPDHISEQQQQLVKAAIDISPLHLEEEAACARGAAASKKGTSLLGATACNVPSGKASSSSNNPESEQKQSTACNMPSGKASSPVEAEQSDLEVERTPPPKQLALNIQWALQVARSKQREQVEANQQQHRQNKRRRAQAEYVAQVREWIDSGDPVLVAEAERILEKMGQAARSG